jgi:hypothetical protein
VVELASRIEPGDPGISSRGVLPLVPSTSLDRMDFESLLRALSGPHRSREATSSPAKFLAFPHASSVRMLLPTGRAGVTALRLASNGIGIPRRLVHTGLSLAMRTHLAGLMVRDRMQIEAGHALRTHLQDLLGVRSLGYAVLVGTPRPNRKPVLVVSDRRGRVVAYGKVGWNMTSNELIRDEAHALRALPPTTATFRAPEVLHLGRWGACEMMLLSPLPQDRRWYKPRDLTLPIQPTVEVATILGTERGELASSGYWAGLVRRVNRAALTAPAEDREALMGQFADLGKRFGGMTMTFGTWHGDWGPWNMSWFRDRLSVWDWERSSRPVPVGFDALHFELQVARHRRGGLRRALVALTQQTDEVLRAFGERDREVGRATRALYLTELMYRRLEPWSWGGDVDLATVTGIRGWIAEEIAHR